MCGACGALFCNAVESYDGLYMTVRGIEGGERAPFHAGAGAAGGGGGGEDTGGRTGLPASPAPKRERSTLDSFGNCRAPTSSTMSSCLRTSRSRSRSATLATWFAKENSAAGGERAVTGRVYERADVHRLCAR